MIMKKITLKPDHHRNNDIIRLEFPYDVDLVKIIKSFSNTRWSKTLNCWYVNKSEFKLNKFYQRLRESAFIDYSLVQYSMVPSLIALLALCTATAALKP